ncbi:hypothetical protein [Streptomyces sp. NPDC127098]|uniref:hypothetical protein n=1 Tax=Streptomyces sp. NPDC127098 TaxID=3347137 RepID=UPI003654B1CF
MRYHCARFTEIKNDYELAISREADSAVLRTGTSNGKVLATNAKVLRRRMANSLNHHLRHCPLCG